MGTQTQHPSTHGNAVPPTTKAPVGPVAAVDSPASRSLSSTRASRAWTRLLPSLLVLAIMLIFVLQNLHSARVSFLGWSGTVPLAVALLAAAAIGGLFVLAIG